MESKSELKPKRRKKRRIRKPRAKIVKEVMSLEDLKDRVQFLSQEVRDEFRLRKQSRRYQAEINAQNKRAMQGYDFIRSIFFKN